MPHDNNIFTINLQLEILVYDTAYPDAKDYSEVVISVIRDESGPIFRPSATYQITIPETTAIGNNFIDVEAIDPDNVRNQNCCLSKTYSLYSPISSILSCLNSLFTPLLIVL